METLIHVEDIYRYYGDTCAVRGVSFELAKGEVLGFLGPNGAGKTSTMQILSGNLAPSSGRVLINGVDLLDEPKRAKRELGYLPETPPLYRELTVDEYLAYCARLHHLRGLRLRSALDNAKERCGLTQVGRRLIGNLSKGYQQRVGIAQAILHLPKVVILDEPTVGLDPIQIREIRALIRELGKEHGIILSTHILPEVQATCHRVQIIHQGVLVYSDTLDQLALKTQSHSLIVAFRSAPAIAELQTIPGVATVESLDDGRLRVRHEAGYNPAPAIAERAVTGGWEVLELTPEHIGLEQIFIDLTCKETPSASAPVTEVGVAA